jgi:hypothetical protein
MEYGFYMDCKKSPLIYGMKYVSPIVYGIKYGLYIDYNSITVYDSLQEYIMVYGI